MRPSRNDLLVQALGAVLKERRLELGMTQEDLAADRVDERHGKLQAVAKRAAKRGAPPAV